MASPTHCRLRMKMSNYRILSLVNSAKRVIFLHPSRRRQVQANIMVVHVYFSFLNDVGLYTI